MIELPRPNQPQTLTGIETSPFTTEPHSTKGPINLKPLQGLKQEMCLSWQLINCGPINLKPLQGLKLKFSLGVDGARRPNQPQTLTGIETRLPCPFHPGWPSPGPINLKPLQGLKPTILKILLLESPAQSTSNPYRD